MNKGKVYDYLNLVHEYTNKAQSEVVDSYTSESNIIRQMRYIKETLIESQNEIGVKVL